MIKKSLTAVAVTAGLVLGGAGVAHATASESKFSTTVPRAQQSHYWEYQKKTTTSASQVNFASIGGGYLMNVKAQNADGGKQYTERKGIAKGSTNKIENKTPKGKSTRLIVTNNTWTAVTVAVTGWFKTN